MTTSCSLFIELAGEDKPREDGTAAGPGGGPGAGGATGSTTTAGGGGESSTTVGQGGTGGEGGGSLTIPTSGLLLWLDGELGVTSDVDGVSQWSDRSGNGLDAMQTITTSKPAVGSIGSRAALEFDGLDDYLDLPQLTADFSNGLTIFAIVVTTDPSQLSCPPIVHFCNGGEVDDISLQLQSDGGILYEVYDASLPTASALSSGVPAMITAVHDADATVRVDGTELASTTMPAPVDVTRTMNYVARGLYGGCGPWQGTIGEVLVYTRPLTANEQTQVEGYLQSKWACCQ